MQSEFYMNHMGELNYFLDLQIKQINNGIFISQSSMPRNFSKDTIWRILEARELQWVLLPF